MSNFDDDFFDDPFERLVNDFFGKKVKRNHKNTIIEGEEEDRTIDFVEDNNYLYLLFELPGYEKNDVDVSVSENELIIKARKKENTEGQVQNYLIQKLTKGMVIKKDLPKFISPKGFKCTLKNGVLEIIFSKR